MIPKNHHDWPDRVGKTEIARRLASLQLAGSEVEARNLLKSVTWEAIRIMIRDLVEIAIGDDSRRKNGDVRQSGTEALRSGCWTCYCSDARSAKPGWHGLEGTTGARKSQSRTREKLGQQLAKAA